MRSATATDFQKNFGSWSKDAMSEPVAIERHGRPRLVLMSYDQYRALAENAAAAGAESDSAEIDAAAIESLKKIAEDASAASGIA